MCVCGFMFGQVYLRTCAQINQDFPVRDFTTIIYPTQYVTSSRKLHKKKPTEKRITILHHLRSMTRHKHLIIQIMPSCQNWTENVLRLLRLL